MASGTLRQGAGTEGMRRAARWPWMLSLLVHAAFVLSLSWLGATGARTRGPTRDGAAPLTCHVVDVDAWAQAVERPAEAVDTLGPILDALRPDAWAVPEEAVAAHTHDLLESEPLFEPSPVAADRRRPILDVPLAAVAAGRRRVPAPDDVPAPPTLPGTPPTAAPPPVPAPFVGTPQPDRHGPAVRASALGVAPLRVLFAPDPTRYYPPSALRAGRTGLVLVVLTIAPTGHVAEAYVASGSGDPLLDAAALALAREHRFNADASWRRTRLPVRFGLPALAPDSPKRPS